MRNVKIWVIAAGILVLTAYLVGVMNGSLARGTFTHQQIVALVTGIFAAKLVDSLFELFRKREN